MCPAEIYFRRLSRRTGSVDGIELDDQAAPSEHAEAEARHRYVSVPDDLSLHDATAPDIFFCRVSSERP